MAKTIHVFRERDGWAVKREGRKENAVVSTQKEAIEIARTIARDSSSGQIVVHSKDGGIRESASYGLPKVQDPPGKHSGARRIEKAVGRFALERVRSDPHPARG